MKKLLLLCLLSSFAYGAQLTYTTSQVQALLDKINTDVYTKVQVDGFIVTNGMSWSNIVAGLQASYSNQVITGDLIFSTTNHYDDLRFSATSIDLAGPATPPAPFVTNGCIYAIAFGTTEFIYLTSQMPHSYAIGTDINPHMHVLNTSIIHTSNWELVSSWKNSAGAMTVPITNTLTLVCTNIPLSETYASFGWLATTNTTLSSMICHKLTRLTGGSATDSLLLEFDDHFQVKYPGGYTNGFTH